MTTPTTPTGNPETEATRLAFWTGCLTGFAVAAGLVLTYFAFHFSAYRATFAEFRAEIPTVSRIVTHPAYLRIAPVAVLGAITCTNLWVERPRTRLALAAAIAVIAALAVAVAHWGATLPFSQLAGGIAAE